MSTHNSCEKVISKPQRVGTWWVKLAISPTTSVPHGDRLEAMVHTAPVRVVADNHTVVVNRKHSGSISARHVDWDKPSLPQKKTVNVARLVTVGVAVRNNIQAGDISPLVDPARRGAGEASTAGKPIPKK